MLGLTAALFAAILALSLSWSFYYESMANAYLSLALASAVIVLGILRHSWFDLLWVVIGALFLAVLDYRVMDYKPFFMAGFSFVGLSALAVLGTRTIWAKAEDRKLLLYGFLPAVLFVASEWTASSLLDITEKLHPKTFDLFLYSFDSSLRVQISFLTGQFLLKNLWLRTASLAIYISLPLPLALVYASQLRRQKGKALAVMIAFLATGPHRGSLLQHAACMRTGPSFRRGVSLESVVNRRGHAAEYCARHHGRSPECHSFPAHELGPAGVVEFAWIVAVGSRRRHDLCGPDGSGNLGDGRTLLHRSGRSISVFAGSAGAKFVFHPDEPP